MQAVGQQHHPRGLQPPGLDGAQEDLRAQAVAADERARAGDLGAEAGEDVGEPVQRVRVARAVLGVAVQRQVGEDDAEAVDEVLHDGLELAVREERGVQEDEARPGARLAVGDPGAVGRVVEAQPHPRRGAATGGGTMAGS